MLMVPCPWCGPRNADDLRYVGESRPRPQPSTATPEEWRRYLYVKNNPAGWTTETWYCRSGCRRYFVVERNTVSNEIRASRLPAAQLRMAAGGEGR
jgi:heterotetrameric sarcosine oxidase delta subunit